VRPAEHDHGVTPEQVHGARGASRGTSSNGRRATGPFGGVRFVRFGRLLLSTETLPVDASGATPKEDGRRGRMEGGAAFLSTGTVRRYADGSRSRGKAGACGSVSDNLPLSDTG
jgi:hypothetical protein